MTELAVRARRALLPVLASALAISAVWPASAATAAIRIGKVQYDSPGTDTRSNSSLNAEWVTIHNTGTSRRTLSGWTLRDAANHVYRFGTYSLGAGGSVRIHTGHGTDTRTDRYWGMGSYVWNNTGDTAWLRNAAGTLVDSCRWGDGSGVTYC